MIDGNDYGVTTNTGNGGGAYVVGGHFYMNGGTMSNNICRNSGGIRATYGDSHHGSVHIWGGTITGNHSLSGGAAGVSLYGSGTFNVKGNPKVYGNTVGTDNVEQNMFFSSGQKMSVVGSIDDTARIGVTCAVAPTYASPVTFTSGYRDNSSARNFTSDNAAYFVGVDANGEATLRVNMQTTHVSAVAETCTTDGNIEYWIGEDGNYYADEDAYTQINLSDTVIPGGHIWRYAASENIITATCSRNCGTASQSLTINASNKVYDGLPVTATLVKSDTIAFPDDYAITYKQGTESLPSAPTDVGTYTASVTVGSATATVSFTITYTITWKNWDGTTLETDTGLFTGATPLYDGATPTRATSGGIYYSFKGWSPAVGAVTGNTVYTAQFDEHPFFAGQSITLNGSIGINYFVDVRAAGITLADIASGSKTLTVSFAWADTENAPYSTPSSYNITTINASNYAQYIDSQNENYLKFACYVAAAEMTSEVRATVTVKNGDDTVYSESHDYSIREYALSAINNPSSSPELVRLAKTMLDYGAKAQTAFGRTEVVLANEGVDYTMSAIDVSDVTTAISSCAANAGKTADMTVVEEAPGVNYYTSSLIFLSECTLRHYYMVWSNGRFQNFRDQFTGQKGNMYYIDKPNIAAAELDEYQEFTVGNTTYYYSALDFVKAIMGKYAPGSANYNLAVATYWYNQAANEYFH